MSPSRMPGIEPLELKDRMPHRLGESMTDDTHARSAAFDALGPPDAILVVLANNFWKERWLESII